MKVDFKITVWESVEFPDEMKDEVIGKLKSGEIRTANQMLETYEGNPDIEYKGKIDETEEQMIPEENDGQNTIEVLEVTHSASKNVGTIYGNGKE